jgi:DNA-binding CsgD family transcriptional regulator
MICGCSEANINFHLSKIRRAFGVNSRKAAIIKAYTLGLIAL